VASITHYHAVAEMFPLIEGDEYAALVEDIRKHGVREPIWLHPDGSIIDGRNRHRACTELGITPPTRKWDGTGSLVEFVLSLNLHRRHLTSSQRAILALSVEPMLAAEAKARQRHGGAGAEGSQIVDYLDVNEGKAAQQAAKAVGTNRQYVADAKAIADQRPDLLEQVWTGELTIPQAKRTLKEAKREAQRDKDRERVVEITPLEKLWPHTTIVIDPPWDWGDEGDQDQLGRSRPDYATMSIDELLALPVGELATTDAHLYMWITNRSLPKGFALMERWGFRYVTMLTWVKPSFGMGNYFRGSTEHVLFGVKGSLMLKRKDLGTHFTAPRGSGGHSSKPSEFFDLVESASPGPWLELFSRQNRQGWTSWPN
jgi:N6-adenosine-specific RNA methylase IME4/ParB-like chromosome segregation protein Spo0J